LWANLAPARQSLGLIEPPGEVVAEKIRFDGLALLELDEAGWASLRGDRICLIFQDPQVRLNPVFSIGSQLAEVLQIHRGLGRQEAWRCPTAHAQLST